MQHQTIHIIQVYGRTSPNTREAQRDICVSYSTDAQRDVVVDLYLTADQANKLRQALVIRLEQNDRLATVRDGKW